MSVNSDLEEIIEDPMGDDDIRFYFPNAKIIKYSDLERYDDIDKLLPNKIDYVFILYQDSPNRGHWCCVSKYEPYCEFFDSYGGRVDSQLGWVPCPIRKTLNQCRPYLSDLFNKSKYEIVYNPIKYQGESDDINTCGRHCVWRVKNLLKGSNLHRYFKMMKDAKNKSGLSYDEIVAELIDKI